MKFLFIGQGYPPVGITSLDSGIGKYLREMCLGLIERGHECHVLVWEDERIGSRSQDSGRRPPFENREGVKVFTQGHAYWPVIERFMPDTRDVWNMRRMVRMLDRQYCYDWIEVGSEEGIAIGVLKDYPEKCVIRIHTTLADMVRDKRVRRDYKVRYRLAREERSFLHAGCVVVSSSFHAKCLKEQFALMQSPMVVPLGYDEPAHGLVDEAEAGGQGESRRVDAQGNPIILVVGSPDRRKGFDRLIPVFRAFVERYSPCTVRMVSRCHDPLRRQFGFCPPYPKGLSIEWYERLPRQDLMRLYAEASVLLQLSRYESFGWPVVEAASQGTPVVSTAVGTAPELLDGSLSEFLVDGDVPISCAMALNRAIQGRAQLGSLLRQRYSDRYTRHAMINRYLEVVTALHDGVVI